MTAPVVPAPAAERRKGYGRWKGERTAQAWRWWVIARGNIALSISNKWVKVALVASLIPGVILSGITYFFLPLSAIVLDGVLDAGLLFAFLAAALMGARLVSEDRRQGAFLAHFSRPVTRWDYLAGKFVALALPLVFVITAGPLFAIAADAAVTGETFVDRLEEQTGSSVEEFDTGGYLREASYWGAIGGVLWFGVIAATTTAGIVLGVSALTTRTRIAGVIWFAIVGLGAAAHGILQEAIDKDWPALLSWLDGLADVSSYLMGIRHDPQVGQSLEFSPFLRMGILAAAAVVGLIVVHEQLRRAEGGER